MADNAAPKQIDNITKLEVSNPTKLIQPEFDKNDISRSFIVGDYNRRERHMELQQPSLSPPSNPEESKLRNRKLSKMEYDKLTTITLAKTEI